MPPTLVGTTGWSHADWVGPFYPVHMREKPEAWLGHYGTRFRTVELASSFDAFPDEALVASWARAGVALQERGGAFEFSLKLPRAITHDALPAGDVEAARAWTGRFDREVLDPLAGEGLLGVVLAQLPPSFQASAANARALAEALAPLAERRLAVELRHASWARGGCLIPELDPVFAGGDVCLVEADLPGRLDVRPALAARHAYLRFHGRRRDVWAAPEPRDGARYDYLYPREELAPWAERVQEHRRAGREVRAYFNNAPRAQAVANALDLIEMLGAPVPVARPRLTAQQRLPL
ncbi:MAG TPA: DUF72 domain-containing protein [Candidatus Thermoplasmatota archaeon]|nr:DUF72 domain-containing protein [Candidatus Thermoplasmatota archaeon]